MAFLMNLLTHLLRNQTVGKGLLMEVMWKVAMNLTVAQGGIKFRGVYFFLMEYRYFFLGGFLLLSGTSLTS